MTKKIDLLNNEEWLVAIKHAGTNKEEISRYSRNKLLTKLFEIMLNLNRIIEEKNHLLLGTIDKLKKINEEKKQKEQENINIYHKLISMRKEVESLMEVKHNNLNSTTSTTSKQIKSHFGKFNLNNSMLNISKINNCKNENNDCSMIVNNTHNNLNDNSGLIEEKDLQYEYDENLEEENNEIIMDEEEDEDSDNKTDVRYDIYYIFINIFIKIFILYIMFTYNNK